MASIYVGNDMNVEVNGAYNPVDSTYFNAATVTFTLLGTNKTTVLAGPTAMPYVTASNGNYMGVLQSSVVSALITAETMVIGNLYWIKKTFVSGASNAEAMDSYPLSYRPGNC